VGWPTLNGQRVALRQGGTLYYLLTDHLGSTALTVDSSGVKVGELRYRAYGETRYTSGTTPTSRRFTGQRREGTIGLYDYGARFYDPLLGRFLSADTVVPQLGNPQALNRYAYVLNNPLRYTDPTGHMIFEEDPDDPYFLPKTGTIPAMRSKKEGDPFEMEDRLLARAYLKAQDLPGGSYAKALRPGDTLRLGDCPGCFGGLKKTTGVVDIDIGKLLRLYRAFGLRVTVGYLADKIIHEGYHRTQWELWGNAYTPSVDEEVAAYSWGYLAWNAYNMGYHTPPPWTEFTFPTCQVWDTLENGTIEDVYALVTDLYTDVYGALPPHSNAWKDRHYTPKSGYAYGPPQHYAYDH